MKTLLTFIAFMSMAIGSVFAQAPASLVGMTLRTHYIDFDGLGSDEVHAIDFFSDGTFRQSLFAELPHLRQGFYHVPGAGTYTYTQTSPSTGMLNLSPNVFRENGNMLVFSSNSQGSIKPGYMHTFSLAPSRGVSQQRALINMSVLLTASRGSPVALGFVVGGTAPFREILIRAVGPTLSQFGVSNPAANPSYYLGGGYSISTSFGPGENNPYLGWSPLGWSATDASTSTLAAEATRTGAFALMTGSSDKADIFLLYPGAYTVIVSPTSSDQEGTELIEVYEVE